VKAAALWVRMVLVRITLGMFSIIVCTEMKHLNFRRPPPILGPQQLHCNCFSSHQTRQQLSHLHPCAMPRLPLSRRDGGFRRVDCSMEYNNVLRVQKGKRSMLLYVVRYLGLCRSIKVYVVFSCFFRTLVFTLEFRLMFLRRIVLFAALPPHFGS
jgi:hypothetical protein